MNTIQLLPLIAGGLFALLLTRDKLGLQPATFASMR